jgi:F1F0 ATPase subunit 2
LLELWDVNMDVWSLVFALAVGLGLGLFYFGTLWMMVRALPDLRHPALWTFVSFLFRMAVVLVAFVAFTEGDVVRMVSVLIGFMIARGVLLRRWGGKARAGSGRVRPLFWKT